MAKKRECIIRSLPTALIDAELSRLPHHPLRPSTLDPRPSLAKKGIWEGNGEKWGKWVTGLYSKVAIFDWGLNESCDRMIESMLPPPHTLIPLPFPNMNIWVWRLPLCGDLPALFHFSKSLFIYGSALPIILLTKVFRSITSGLIDASISKALSVVKHNLSPPTRLAS